ncbi:hypothetical protein [Flagellimonas allohymeniacidonis]|uniref:Lipoprotein n=1 Tax=Flagellimonas allohymeniacidonis TaxID=2517819 RepID=A0A4Q8QGP6_9FLAO|nr:hypothetical protein [Allomuricauda hymeniacidonis]TAI47559.1 hypothetical protein EW142_12895 [Allomuricauda hymeniacidonis]
MKRFFLVISLISFLSSCVPLRIALNIEDYKIVKGKRFRRGLPKKDLFIFEDPKRADEFFHYVHTKFDLKGTYVDINVPFQINGNQYFFSFYETDIPDKTINLVPLVADALLSSAEMGPMFEEVHESRNGNYYIAIEAYDENGENCLSQNYVLRKEVIAYLSQLKQEYLNTSNYNEVVFKN